jgi:hypothetical protein
MADLQIFSCSQGTDEWFRARMGIPTASEFATVMRKKGKNGDGSSVERRKYILKTATEIYLGEPSPQEYTNASFERGKAMEAEARGEYLIGVDDEYDLIGFARNGDIAGCSPDCLVGPSGVLEIKTALPHVLADFIDRDDPFPAQHRAQCQGALWVLEREWVDLKVYWPGMPDYTVRAYRDDDYIRELAAAVEQFNGEVAEKVEKLRKR